MQILKSRFLMTWPARIFILLAMYTLLFFFPPSLPITRLFSEFNLGTTILMIVFIGLVFKRKGPFWETLALILILMLFALSLINRWQTAEFGGQLLGGYLPLSDAQNYYADAQRLLAGNHVGVVSTRRPYFAGFLSFILYVTGNHLQISQVIMVAVVAISVYLAAREIQTVSDPFGAAVYLMVCYWYYFPFAGAVMTETLGLSLGSLALAFLIKATRSESSLKYFGHGLFALTVALNARQGPFLILMTLILWMAVLLYRENKTRYIFSLILVVALGMIANTALSKLIGTPRTTPFSMYSQFLYGLATGGKSWAAAAQDHPELTEREVFKLSIELFMNDPGPLFKAVADSYRDYFAPVNGGFSFMRLVYDRRNLTDRILWGLCLTGLVVAIMNFRQKKYGLILAGFAGILKSVAFLSPKNSDDMRIYAATMPFSFYMVSMGVHAVTSLAGKLSKSPAGEQEVSSSTEMLQPVSSGILLASLVGAPLVMMLGNSPSVNVSVECPSGQQKISFHIGNQASVKLLTDDEIAESYMPNIQLSDFRQGVVSGLIYTYYPSLDQELLSLQEDQTINIVTYSIPMDAGGYLVTSGPILPAGNYTECASGPKNDGIEVPWFYLEGSDSGYQTQASFLTVHPVLLRAIRVLYLVGFLFMIVMTLMDSDGLRWTPWWKRLLFLGNITIMILGVCVYLHSNALFSFSWQRTSLNVESAISSDEYAYQIPLGVNWMSQKSIRKPPVTVYEDGIPLEYPNAKIYAVKHLGQGRFLVQSGSLYMSASDNSDPRVNGRNYEIEWPTPIRARYQWMIYLMAMLAVFLHVQYFAGPSKKLKPE